MSYPVDLVSRPHESACLLQLNICFVLSLIYPQSFLVFLSFQDLCPVTVEELKVKLKGLKLLIFWIEHMNVYPAVSLFATTNYFCY